MPPRTSFSLSRACRSCSRSPAAARATDRPGRSSPEAGASGRSRGRSRRWLALRPCPELVLDREQDDVPRDVLSSVRRTSRRMRRFSTVPEDLDRARCRNASNSSRTSSVTSSTTSRGDRPREPLDLESPQLLGVTSVRARCSLPSSSRILCTRLPRWRASSSSTSAMSSCSRTPSTLLEEVARRAGRPRLERRSPTAACRRSRAWMGPTSPFHSVNSSLSPSDERGEPTSEPRSRLRPEDRLRAQLVGTVEAPGGRVRATTPPARSALRARCRTSRS